MVLTKYLFSGWDTKLSKKKICNTFFHKYLTELVQKLGPTTEDLVTKYFSTLDKDDILKLYNIYKLDFQYFQYHFKFWLNMILLFPMNLYRRAYCYLLYQSHFPIVFNLDFAFKWFLFLKSQIKFSYLFIIICDNLKFWKEHFHTFICCIIYSW